MGLIISPITDIRIDNCRHNLSRNFCYLLCGLDAHANHEIGQLEKALGCDLMVLKQMDLYHYTEDEENAILEYDAQNHEDRIKIQNRFSIGRVKAYQNINDLKNTLKELLLKIYQLPSFYEILVYNEDWIYQYFKEGEFENDIKNLLDYAACTEEKGAKMITFMIE